MTDIPKELVLDISGLGIVFFSPELVRHIPEGSNYLATSYTTERQVQSHIQAGTVVGFGTGTPGVFILRCQTGYPEESQLLKSEFKLRLGLRCAGGTVCFRDLYDLSEWHSSYDHDKTIKLDDGIYHVTLCSDVPESGVLGDRQIIEMYFQKLDAFPRLSTQGIPTLCL